MSPSEQDELIDGMQQTRTIIKSRLEAHEVDASLMNMNERLEYQWDLWMIIGILDHGLKFRHLEQAKNAAQSRNEQPDFTFT